MAHTLEELREDHTTIRRLLRQIVSQSRALSECLNRKEAFKTGQSLRETAHFIARFLHNTHHPREEVLLDHLVEFDPGYSNAVNIVLQEHRYWEKQTASFCKILEAGLTNSRHTQSCVHIASVFHEQIPVFIDIEENILFPVISRSLNIKRLKS